MREIHTEIEIDAPPERVWAVLTNLGAYADWNPFITSARGELKEGARLEIFVQIPDAGGRGFKPRVLAVNPSRELRWLGQLAVPGLFNGEHIFRLEPLPGNRARFLHGERFTGLLIPFLGGMLEKTERGYELMNRALKQRAESAAQP